MSERERYKQGKREDGADRRRKRDEANTAQIDIEGRHSLKLVAGFELNK